MPSIYSFCSKFSIIWSLMCSSAAFVDFPAWNPYCGLHIYVLSIQKLFNPVYYYAFGNFTKERQSRNRSVIKSFLPAPLNINFRHATFILSGNTPVSNMRLQICTKGPARNRSTALIGRTNIVISWRARILNGFYNTCNFFLQCRY